MEALTCPLVVILKHYRPRSGTGQEPAPRSQRGLQLGYERRPQRRTAADGAQNSDKEDTGSGSGGRCADHESQLDWYCSTEDRLICSHCAATGTCKSHTVTPVFKKAADMRVSENDTRTRMLDALSDCTRAEPIQALTVRVVKNTRAHCACDKEYTRALCLAMGSAARVYRSLQGLFAVYKPPGVHWKLVRDTVETSLIRDLNSLGSPAPRQAIRFLPGRSEGTDRSELTLTAARLPVLADHPLVKGPEFHRLKVGVGHRLDVRSSGVFGVHSPGAVWKSHDDFSDSGRLIEKTTFDHISRDKLEKILAVIQGTNQTALLTFSGVDLKSQEAYELAVKGLLRPLQKTPPIITGVRCVRFAPPEFTLEIQCLNETPQYLRKLIHEIGLELRSAAVCSHVRRTRDGFFTLPDALLRSHWDLRSVREAVRQTGPRVRAALSRGEAEPGQG
ncbi:UNVERIFIED_CONTAM: hypothetical protein FKN15_045999 [Acipenser sinensis]